MSNIIVGALAAIPVSFLAWLAYNWAGKPILDTRSTRLEALKAVELYGFTGYGHGEDKESRAKDGLIEAAAALRSLSRGQPWTARLYCQLLGYDLEFVASVLMGLASLVGAHLGQENSSRRDSVDAIYVLLNAAQHLSAERTCEIKEKLRITLALPRG
jgi:hypothetical protein